ncbi:hypothetical protein ACFX1X_038655 [Malus domestica]
MLDHLIRQCPSLKWIRILLGSLFWGSSGSTNPEHSTQNERPRIKFQKMGEGSRSCTGLPIGEDLVLRLGQQAWSGWIAVGGYSGSDQQVMMAKSMFHDGGPGI